MFASENLTSEIAKKAQAGSTGDFVKISRDADFCIITQKYVDLCLERIKSFKVYEDDIWLISFPKAGSTWTREIIRLIESNFDINNDVKKFLFLEFNSIDKDMQENRCDQIENMSRPRFIKSHLPAFLLPDELWSVKPKIIYVARNPKDVAVSYYHHHFHLEQCEISIDEFMDAFVTDQMLFSPFNQHVLEFWKIHDEKNLIFLFYEDMKRDFDGAVKKLANFLGKSFTQDQIDSVCDFLSFEKMKKNPKINLEMYNSKDFTFIRKGKIGSYKEELSQEQIERLDEFSKYPDFKTYGFAYKF